ncbi:hypothetical protein FQR65_LT13350 [Abscondita terminalis]|nr:hypothetical protein FQR65_LT13350 [Abscondita terminalis]
MFHIETLPSSTHLPTISNSYGLDMIGYPSILTPPMDSPNSSSMHSIMMSPDSGCSSPPYLLPNSNSSSSYGSYNYGTSPVPNAGPYLRIIEQPIDRFRFRYKSEMSGTHGSLNGKTSDRTRKQTFPSVELLNYDKPAIIRCSLYQYGREGMEHTRQLHAHRLVKKQGTDEIDDPHDIQVNSETGYIANFHSMGIIHTAKKFIVPELVRKNTILKQEEIARQEHKFRWLTKKEELEVKTLAEKESKSINLNVVCLRFDAFEVINNIYFPICSPVYTHGINNLKSALTGDLKIVRMDHCTSSCRGGREIFILVEKVTKKNIKVRFFELDDEDNEIWSDYGRFSDLDVHHQYAIVFKTPPYKVLDIENQVRVYIELQRPSDGARSDPKDFTYTPCEITLGKKRQRYNSDEYSRSPLPTAELPLTLNHISQNYEIPSATNPPVSIINTEDIEAAMRQNNFDSTELDNFCQSLIWSNSIRDLSTPSAQELGHMGLVMDTPSIAPGEDKGNSSNTKTKGVFVDEQNLIRRVKTEISSFIKTNPNSGRMAIMLKNLVCGKNYISSSGNNILHMLANEKSENHFSKYFLELLCKYDQSSLINSKNTNGQTPLQVGIEQNNAEFVQNLINEKVNISLPDNEGNTALHIAASNHSSVAILKLIFNPAHHVEEFVDNFNYEGLTALHLAIKTNNINAAKVLIWSRANVNLSEMKHGYSPLHLAVANKHLEMMNFLLENNNTVCDSTDFRGYTALKLAKVLVDETNPITTQIYDDLENFMKKNGKFNENLVKEEVEDSDDEVENLETQLENCTLSDKYDKITNFTEDCLNSLSDLLDKTDTWQNLAESLDYGHLLKTDIFKTVGRPTKSLLNFAITNGNTVKQIRDKLDILHHKQAVEIIDVMGEFDYPDPSKWTDEELGIPAGNYIVL